MRVVVNQWTGDKAAGKTYCHGCFQPRSVIEMENGKGYRPRYCAACLTKALKALNASVLAIKTSPHLGNQVQVVEI